MRLLFAAFAFAVLSVVAPGVAGAAGPVVAVLNFDTSGLTSNWWGAFQPGVAISDLVTDQLVNGGKFSVVDRNKLTNILQEHQLGNVGEVSPATAVASGQLIGARYLIVGNVLQFALTSQSGGSGFGGGLPFVGGASVRTQRVTLRVAVRVIDALTGQILQSFPDEESKSSTSWSTGGLGGFTGGFVGGSYSNTQFTSTTMGQLINTVAADVANKLDPTKFVASAPAGPSLSGKIIAVDGQSFIINLGSAAGVTVGTFFDVVNIRQIKDPDSGKMLTSRSPVGKIQIISVDADTAVGKALPGSNGLGATSVGATVQTGQ
ncbi:MAG TPA: CsgG/HfaB family protein [Candidatus Binatia bacterium]|nr:CsgG/HfaB family protein [Candidatus Binatia bacterium]